MLTEGGEMANGAMVGTVVVDGDAVAMVLSSDERTRERDRAAIDEIARRYEIELARRGIEGVEVVREYRTTGRYDRVGDDVPLDEIADAVLIDQVDAIRAAVLGTDDDGPDGESGESGGDDAGVIAVGDTVETVGLDSESSDAGRVMDCDNLDAWVAWDSGVTTPCPLRRLRVVPRGYQSRYGADRGLPVAA